VTALVLIHAFPLSGAMWGHEVRALRDAADPIIAPSLPGFGGTAVPRGDASMDDYADSVVAAMDAAKVERGLLLPPGPAAYRFADDAELRALLEGAGLDAVEVGAVEFAYTVASLDELWDGVRTGSVRTAAQLRALDDDERARVRGALDDLLERRRSTGGLELETAVKIAVGISPGE